MAYLLRNVNRVSLLETLDVCLFIKVIWFVPKAASWRRGRCRSVLQRCSVRIDAPAWCPPSAAVNPLVGEGFPARARRTPTVPRKRAAPWRSQPAAAGPAAPAAVTGGRLPPGLGPPAVGSASRQCRFPLVLRHDPPCAFSGLALRAHSSLWPRQRPRLRQDPAEAGIACSSPGRGGEGRPRRRGWWGLLCPALWGQTSLPTAR